MNDALFYTPPSDTIFEEVKKASMELWQEIDTDHDKFGYATEKINKIKDMPNVLDNMMYMVSMFDIGNQMWLARKLSPEAKLAIKNRLIAGGNSSEYIVF